MLKRYAAALQAVSCDEAFIEIDPSRFTTLHPWKECNIKHSFTGQQTCVSTDITTANLYQENHPTSQRMKAHEESISLSTDLTDTRVPMTDTVKFTSIIEICQKIHSEVKCKTGCDASMGVAGTMLLARLSTNRAKPCGVYCYDGPMEELVDGMSLDCLPGVG